MSESPVNAVRLPAPVRPGATIAVTAPSAGVATELRPRLDFAVSWLEGRGYRVRLGDCLGTPSQVSAPPAVRAAELTDLLLDPTVNAVIPPWGGETGIDLLRFLDWDRLRDADPTWLVGYSDLSTLLVPMTVRCGWATLHGANLMDTPYRVPPQLSHWLDVVTLEPGSRLVQRSSTVHRGPGFDDWIADPTTDLRPLDRPGSWRRLDGRDESVSATGVLIGGCLETVGNLPGSGLADLATFAPGAGLLVYLEASETNAFDVARRLHGLRLAGWFDRAAAVLIGRTDAPDDEGFTQEDAVDDALGDLSVPVLLDVDCGHVAPMLMIVNGASATVSWSPVGGVLEQLLPA